ncbi:MAG: ATP-binding cassette domain-containing protein, partial [Thermodesulfobacteriota bacterium]
MSEPLLRVSGLNKQFGAVQASSNLTFEVQKGEIHGLIGPNGAGKTTAIKQLSGEIIPDSGSVFFEGRDITKLPAHSRAHLGLARSYQVTSVFNRLSVLENIALAVQAHQGHS